MATANEYRPQGTIACTTATTYTITVASLKTAFGYTSEPCEIGSERQRFNVIKFTMTGLGVVTWAIAADFFGAGTYQPVDSGLANGDYVAFHPSGGMTSSGTPIPPGRPFSFQITTSE